jgi:hypothetical protein
MHRKPFYGHRGRKHRAAHRLAIPLVGIVLAVSVLLGWGVR